MRRQIPFLGCPDGKQMVGWRHIALHLEQLASSQPQQLKSSFAEISPDGWSGWCEACQAASLIPEPAALTQAPPSQQNQLPALLQHLEAALQKGGSTDRQQWSTVDGAVVGALAVPFLQVCIMTDPSVW